MTKKNLWFVGIVCVLFFAGTLSLYADDKAARQDKVNKEMEKFGIKPGGGEKDSGSKDSSSKDSDTKDTGTGTKDAGGAKKDDSAKSDQPASANGSVTNTGKAPINIEARDTAGYAPPKKELKPGESMDLPKDTATVGAYNLGKKGDGVHFKITQPNGDEAHVHAPYDNDWASGKVNHPNTIHNNGNDTVIVEGKTESGGTSLTQVGPGKHADLPTGTKEVRIKKDPLKPGSDKNPNVEVVGPDGSAHDIKGYKKWEKVTEDKPADNKSTSQADFDQPGVGFAGNPGVRGSEIGETPKSEGSAADGAQCPIPH